MELGPDISAVVTGGASGLGEGAARALAGLGVRVALFDMNAARGEALVQEIGGVFCKVDVVSDEEVEAAFARARAAHGQERVLVNCAGIVMGAKTVSRRKDGQLVPFPLAEFERVVRVNLVGAFRCMTHAALGMARADPLASGERGAIVNTASVAAEDGQVGQAAYAASKAGVVGMTLPTARDLAGEGVRVNAIMPGLFNTPMMAGLPDAVRQSLSAAVPFPARLGDASEFASMVLELCRNGYVNGAAIRLDGAVRLAPR